MKKSIEIKIPAEPQFLKIVRIAVGHICEIIDFPPEERNNITLAVDEACSNIIKYAYNQPTSEVIHVSCIIYRDKLEFILRDYGKKANIKKIKSRHLDDVRPGGLGVYFIKTVMDEVVYDTGIKVGNKLKLIKYINCKDR